jgi:hypothetical protein
MFLLQFEQHREYISYMTLAVMLVHMCITHVLKM